MDLQLYFDPVDFEHFQTRKKFSRQTLGYHIEKATKSNAEISNGKVHVALIGAPFDHGTPNKGSSKAPMEIRKHLYELSNFETRQRIIDLGNLRPGKSSQDIYYALRDVTDYLREAGVITVILGGGQDLSIGIARAFVTNKEFTITIADARVDIKTQREATDSTNFITRILRENPTLFHLQMLGIQEHYVSPSVIELLKKNTFETMQLGAFRDDVSSIEPLLRNTHFLSFDVSAIRRSDAPAHYKPSPNGFYGEEACLICRYAGLSNRLTAFGLFEFNPGLEKSGATADLAAQMVWYFIEGAIRRRREDPIYARDAFTRYYVEMEDHGEPLVFYHQPATNRWWIEIFPAEGESFILACKEYDYKQAITKEVPDICWRYVRKTIRLSK